MTWAGALLEKKASQPPLIRMRLNKIQAKGYFVRGYEKIDWKDQQKKRGLSTANVENATGVGKKNCLPISSRRSKNSSFMNSKMMTVVLEMML